jgi:signal transduction histidine kinase/ligand-binding sensor domain-containing protein
MKRQNKLAIRLSPILLLFLIHLFTGFSFSIEQESPLDFLYVRSWSSNEGLPTSSVTSVIQSQDGYIWIGTQSGLVRFDGIDFKTYNSDNTPVLESPYITCLANDGKGGLWIGTDSAGIVYHKDGVFRSFKEKDGLSHNNSRTILCSRDGSVWIGTVRGLNHYSDGKLEKPVLPDTLVDKTIWCLYEDKNGQMWIGTKSETEAVGSLMQVTRKGSRLDIKSTVLSGYNMESLYRDSKGTLWIGTRFNGLFGLLPNGGKLHFDKTKGLSDNNVSALYEDSEGVLWIGTYGGGLQWLKDGILLHPAQDSNFANYVIKAFYEDHEKSLWIGTSGAGLHQLKSSRVITYSHKHGIPPNLYGAFQDSKGTLWFGTVGSGITYLKNDRFYRYTTADGLPHNSPFCIAEDKEGALWFGTYGGGIVRLKNGTFKGFSFGESGSHNFFRSVFVDRSGTLWAGNDEGTLFSYKNGKFIKEEFLGSSILCILEDSRLDRWIGTWDKGLYYFPTSGMARRFESFVKPISTIYEDTNGIIWIGTFSNGLHRFIQSERDFKAIKKKDGLPDNAVWGILEDHENNFWISSNRGIYKLQYSDLEDFVKGTTSRIKPCTIYGKEDGMLSIEGNGGVHPSCWKDSSGKLWFPTSKGLSVIDPGNIKKNDIPPPVVLQSVKIDDVSFNINRKIIAKPGSGNVEIQYAGLSYEMPQKVYYQYMLDGYTPKWTNVGTRRTAFYTNLPPGTYRFHVKACNNDGLWNEEGATVEFQLLPHFHQTIYFYILLGIMLILLIAFLINRRTRQIKIREKELVQLVEERTQDLMETNSQLAKANEAKGELLNIVAHDLRNRLQIVLGYADLIENDPKCPPSISKRAGQVLRSSSQMAELIDETLESAVIDSGYINLKMERMNISKLANFTVSAHQLIAQKKEQRILVAIEDSRYVMGDRGRLREVIDNLLNNAIKYSPFKKDIRFTLMEHEETIRIEVEDEGPGLSTEDLQHIFKKFQRLSARPTGGEASTGLGLSITKGLVELHNGKISVESEFGRGSRFIVELPVCREAAAK